MLFKAKDSLELSFVAFFFQHGLSKSSTGPLCVGLAGVWVQRHGPGGSALNGEDTQKGISHPGLSMARCGSIPSKA